MSLKSKVKDDKKYGMQKHDFMFMLRIKQWHNLKMTIWTWKTKNSTMNNNYMILLLEQSVMQVKHEMN
jgi:hypothetical protein